MMIFSYLDIAKALVVTGLLTTGADGAELVGQKTVTDDWIEHKIRWETGPPTYTARWRAFPENGVVVICGAGIYTGKLQESRRVMRDRVFYIDETPYMKDMSFFAKISRSKKLVGASANCASTGKPPPRSVKDGVSLQSGSKWKRIRAEISS